MQLRCCWLIGLVLLVGGWTSSAAGEQREAWTTSKLVGSPEPPPRYRVEALFPQLKFNHPVDIAFAPPDDRVFIVEQDGKIFSFANANEVAQPDLVADFKQFKPQATAAYAIAFHPDFEHNRYVYVCYVEGSFVPDGSYVSRFELTKTNPPTLDPASECVIIRWWAGGHNGCALKFGKDGYLYISTGDGAEPSPPDSLRAGQDVSNLLSAILRIDVDHAEGDRAYRIPPDNPFVGLEGARPEIWAYGFRNPWRMSFDRATGDLWVGDVGWQLWEMIYRIERGGNYGWSIMEGPQPVLPEDKRGPTPILPPTVAHPHSEASSITGGFVYRGSGLPELQGMYIYGDFQTGTIWGLRHDGQQVTHHEVLARTPLQIVSFGEDSAGELYILHYEQGLQIHRMVKNDVAASSEAFPRTLSATGLFQSVVDQRPAAGVLPYSINAHQWSDGATSERWLAVPGTAPLTVNAGGALQFPDGAVLAKTVSVQLQPGDAASRRRLETQILQREAGSWRPYTYIWNEEQTDAVLADAGGQNIMLEFADPSAAAGLRRQTYRVSSRTECQMCHNPWVEAKFTVYGVQTASPLATMVAQLNVDVAGSGSSHNQLTALQQQGWLDLGSFDLAAAGKLANPYDMSADVNERARAYLHVNCAHCHQPHAGGTSTIELGYDVKLENAKAVDERPTQGTFGIADARIIAPGDPLRSVLFYRISKLGGGRMPRVGSNEVDERGVAVIHDWIAQLPGGDPQTAALRPADLAAIEAIRTETDDAAAAIAQLCSTTRGALALMRLVEQGPLAPTTRDQVIATAARHPLAEVRDLFERFLPPDQRLERLGDVVNTAELLALPGNAERGKTVFFREGTASCKSCHRVLGSGENIGPELSQIGKKYSRQELLTHLLEPSKFMEPQFVPVAVETADGRVITGLMTAKDEREVVLRDAQQEYRVAADEIERLVPQQKSMMPDLLLRDLTPQEAADLLEYLSSLK